MHNIFRVLEISYCLSRELYLSIVNPSSSLPVLSLSISISVCEFYGRWTAVKIFRNRESKISNSLITVSVFVSVSVIGCSTHRAYIPIRQIIWSPYYELLPLVTSVPHSV